MQPAAVCYAVVSSSAGGGLITPRLAISLEVLQLDPAVGTFLNLVVRCPRSYPQLLPQSVLVETLPALSGTGDPARRYLAYFAMGASLARSCNLPGRFTTKQAPPRRKLVSHCCLTGRFAQPYPLCHGSFSSQVLQPPGTFYHEASSIRAQAHQPLLPHWTLCTAVSTLPWELL